MLTQTQGGLLTLQGLRHIPKPQPEDFVPMKTTFSMVPISPPTFFWLIFTDSFQMQSENQEQGKKSGTSELYLYITACNTSLQVRH